MSAMLCGHPGAGATTTCGSCGAQMAFRAPPGRRPSTGDSAPPALRNIAGGTTGARSHATTDYLRPAAPAASAWPGRLRRPHHMAECQEGLQFEDALLLSRWRCAPSTDPPKAPSASTKRLSGVGRQSHAVRDHAPPSTRRSSKLRRSWGVLRPPEVLSRSQLRIMQGVGVGHIDERG